MLRQHDNKGFSYLYDRYAGALYGVILSIVDDAEMGADILQEVFVKIWRNIDRYDTEKGRLFTWMFNIARNQSLDVKRSKHFRDSRLSEPLTDTHSQLPGHPYPENHLSKLVAALRKEHSILIELSYFQGYTQEEIARQLNIPLGTVKTKLGAALKALRKMEP